MNIQRNDQEYIQTRTSRSHTVGIYSNTHVTVTYSWNIVEYLRHGRIQLVRNRNQCLLLHKKLHHFCLMIQALQ